MPPKLRYTQLSVHVCMHIRITFFDFLFSVYGHKNCLLALLSNRAEVNCRDFYQRTPLHFAVGGSSDNDVKSSKISCVLVEYLLNCDASMTLVDSGGRLPLHWAASTGKEYTYPILSYPILSYPILSYPILSYPILSYPILSYPILSYPILSYPILSYPILSYPILSYPILSYPILSYPILSYPILSYPILSYPTLIRLSILFLPISNFLPCIQTIFFLTNSARTNWHELIMQYSFDLFIRLRPVDKASTCLRFHLFLYSFDF